MAGIKIGSEAFERWMHDQIEQQLYGQTLED